MKIIHPAGSILLIILTLVLSGCNCLLNRPSGPAQPTSGPGSNDYKHHTLNLTSYDKLGQQFYIFEPANPTPASAPVIVFIHGWGATNPAIYGAWIKHLVSRGNIVIYPRYQTSILTIGNYFTPNAAVAVYNAIEHLQSGNHVRPELDRIAFVGHSAGGAIVANLAASLAETELPKPKAVMCVEPIDRQKGKKVGIPLEDMSLIPADILLITIAGDNDLILGPDGARQIYEETTQIPACNKNYVIFQSDNRGEPKLPADHHSPIAVDNNLNSLEPTVFPLGVVPWDKKFAPNAMDYFGYWKILDALTDTAFYGKNRDYAFGNTPQQRYMGTWSNGQPIKEIIVNKFER